MMSDAVWPQKIAYSEKGMVAAQHYEAAGAGSEILEEGGNAIDAAIAAAFCLGVCEPAASGLGGQTMMLIRLARPNRTFAVDGSSRAPNRATLENISEKKKRLTGYKAATVPSTPAVLSYILNHYGTLPLSRILEPAIRLAEKGYTITRLQNHLQARETHKWKKNNASDFFLMDKLKPYPEGSVFKQPVLAQTLKQLSKKGIEDFYTGDIAGQIEEDMKNNGGFIQRDDLSNIPYPIERRPVSCKFMGLRVVTFPPPGAGRSLIQMLNILNQYDPKYYDPNKLKGMLRLCEIMRRVQLDRIDRPFDPAFYPQVQDRRMLTDDYAKLVKKQIEHRLKSTKKSSGETTHLSVMDNQGNVAALTQSIERVYGSFTVTPGLGFLYNNYMSAFEYKDMTHPYYLRPNGVPWASVAPTIIFRGKRPFLTIGSPGSERIVSSILQVLIRILNGQNPLDAVSAPRFHCTLDGKIHIEASRIRNDATSFFNRHGFETVEHEPFSFYLGCVQMVMQNRKDYIGVADLRRDGAACGPMKK